MTIIDMISIKQIKYLLILALPILASSHCEGDLEPLHYDITFVNSSNEPIYIGGIGYMSDLENDITVVYVLEKCSIDLIKIIPGHFETHTMNNLPGKIDQYMIFRESTMKKYSREELIELNIYDYLFKGPYKEISKYNKEWGYYIEYK